MNTCIVYILITVIPLVLAGKRDVSPAYNLPLITGLDFIPVF
jgi:heme/copper-type cytochrome/quinol oxidase subunit 4